MAGLDTDMYSKTSDRGTYLKRVASHATKPRASGLIEDIPAWAEKEKLNDALIAEYKFWMSVPYNFLLPRDKNIKGHKRTKKIFLKIRQYWQLHDVKNVQKWKKIWIDERIASMRIKQVHEDRIKKYGKKPKSGWPRNAPGLHDREHKVVKGFK